MSAPSEETRRGRRLALWIAGLGLAYIVAVAVGGAVGLAPRVLALFDLIALAGFGWAIWQAVTLWRERERDKD